MMIIKFEKDNCTPCTLVSSYLDTFSIEYEKINPFNNPELAVKYKVRSVPTVILIEQGQELERVIGFKEEELKNLINKYLMKFIRK